MEVSAFRQSQTTHACGPTAEGTLREQRPALATLCRLGILFFFCHFIYVLRWCEYVYTKYWYMRVVFQHNALLVHGASSSICNARTRAATTDYIDTRHDAHISYLHVENCCGELIT